MRALALVLTVVTTPAALAQATIPSAKPSQQAPSALERIKAAEQASQNLQRATNLARNTAVQRNGGLGVYQPAPCMVDALQVKSCLISRGPDGFVFRFPGGAPGWIAEQKPASFETEIRIAADGRSVLTTIYNGAPRTASDKAGGTACPCVCPPATRPNGV